LPLPFTTDTDELALRKREVEALRVEYRRLEGRIRFRTRRGWLFLALLIVTIVAALGVVIFLLSPASWLGNQQTRFTQMVGLLLVLAATTPLGGYFARRFDRQRQRVKVAEERRHEIRKRFAQLDEAGGRRRRRRRKRRSWIWRIEHPESFKRPPIETMTLEELEESADGLGAQVLEEQAMRAFAYAHAGITGVLALLVAFVVTLSGPEYLGSLLRGGGAAGGAGPDPLIFWLTLTVTLIVLGGIGSHRVTVLMRRARAYQERLRAVERALWEARVLLRERREEV
jgi:hypothetical protein